MRILAILGLATIVALQSAPAALPLTAQGGGRWEGVPNLPLRPPANVAPRPMAPAPGQWNGRPHWQGQANGAGPSWTQAGWQGGGRAWGGGSRGHHFRPRPGVFLPPVFISPSFYVQDWRGYGLAQPGYGQYWMRYDDDALLLDARGYVYDMVPGVDWRSDGWDEGYDDYDGDEAWYQDDVVTCCGGYRMSYAPVVHYVPAGTTTVIIQNPAVVTRTSYVEEEVVPAAPKKAWKPKRSWKPRKVWKPRPQCRC